MPEAHDLGRLAARRARWRDAEAHVYPLAMVDADGYQRAVTTVATILETLRRDVLTLDQLVDLSEAPPAELVALACAGALTVAADDLIGAACAGREREIGVQAQLSRRAEACRLGRSAGQRWVEVEPAPTSFVGLRSGVPELVVHLASGLGLRTDVDVDPDTGMAALLVVPVRVDTGSGVVLDAAGELGEPRHVADREAWTMARDELVESIERLT